MAIDGFDDGYGDPSDYGMSQEDFNDASAIGQATYSGDSDQLAQAIANSTARARSDPRALSDPSRSNVIGMANYDPSFAASLDISRGLDPRGIAGFKDTVFAKTNTPNPLQQLDQTQVNRITDALKLSGASDTYKQVSSLRGDDLKNYAAGMDLKGLNLADFDKMDTQSLANVFSSLGMTDKNPYGISAQGTSTGTIGAISNLLGLDTTPDFSRKGTPTYMSPKDIAEKARAGLGFASSGRDPSEFGSLSGIANQFGRDVSAGSKQITDQLLNLADGAMSYIKSPFENIAAEQKRIEIADLEEARQKQGLNLDFKPINFPAIQRTNVLDNSFMNSNAKGIANTTVGKEVASNFPVAPPLKSDLDRLVDRSRESAETIDSRLGQIKTNNALQAVFDMLNKETANVEIDAGENKGARVNMDPFKEENREIELAQALKNSGYNFSVPDSSLGNPKYTNISLREDQNPVFAGTNQSIFGGKDSRMNYTSPFTENELNIMTDSGFNLGTPTYEERPSLVVPIDSLNSRAQEVNALRSNMDYNRSFPLQTILDGRRSVRDGEFSQEEMNKLLSGFPR